MSPLASQARRIAAGAVRGVVRDTPRTRQLRYAVGRGGSAERSTGPGWVQYTSRRWLLVEPPRRTERAPVAIHLVGGCDVPALFAMAPLFRSRVERGIAIVRADSGVSSARADLLLQTLEHHEGLEQAARRLELGRDATRPVVFDAEVALPGIAHPPVDVGVVVLSIGANAVRAAYRHKEHGFLIDPGGYWLGGARKADPRVLRWFEESFEPVGRLEVDEITSHLDRLVTEIRARAGAEVMVLNALTVEPGEHIHSYQLRRQLEGARRRDLHVAVAELGRQRGFHVLDVDRALKQAGIAEQIDFAHFPEARYGDIAAVGHHILRDLEVLP